MNQHKTSLLVGNIVLFTLSSSVLALRVFVRRCIINAVGWDDYTIIVAWFFNIGTLTASLYAWAHGLGSFTRDVSSTQQIQANLGVWVGSLAYHLTSSAIKISILLFCFRLTNGRKSTLYHTIRLIFTVQTVVTISFVFAFVFQCWPVSKFWTLSPEGTCFDITTFYYVHSVVSLLMDLIILILPIPTLLSIQQSLSLKLSLLGLFILGGMTTIASGYRFTTIHTYSTSTDPMYDGAPINLWSNIELNFGLICACGPALKIVAVNLRRLITNFVQSFRHDDSCSISFKARFQNRPEVVNQKTKSFYEDRNPEKPKAWNKYMQGHVFTNSRNSMSSRTVYNNSALMSDDRTLHSSSGTILHNRTQAETALSEAAVSYNLSSTEDSLSRVSTASSNHTRHSVFIQAEDNVAGRSVVASSGGVSAAEYDVESGFDFGQKSYQDNHVRNS